jgi:hypothetical protein
MTESHTYGYNTDFWKLYAMKICDDFGYHTAAYKDFESSVGGQRLINNEFANMNTNYFYINKYLLTIKNPYLTHAIVGEEIFMTIVKWIARRIKCTLAELIDYEDIKSKYINDDVQIVSIDIETKEIDKDILGTHKTHILSELSVAI